MGNKLSPEEIVQKQLDCYNNHDINGFCSLFAEDIKAINLVDNSIIVEGMKNFRERYSQRFSNPNLYAELTNRMVIGNKVIDYEEVRGLEGNKIVKAVAIYEIKEDIIVKVWFLHEE